MSEHQHEGWQLRPSLHGGEYCGACGERVTPTPDDAARAEAVRASTEEGEVMSDDDGYTPTTDDVRKAGAYFDHDYTPQGFDRWLAAHDAEVRADERARIAAEKAKWQAEALRVAADALSGLPAEDWRRAYPDQHLEAVADAIDPEVRAVERERRGDEP